VHALTNSVSCTLQLVHQVVAVAVSFHSYQLLSFIILARITPVAHSVANCMKRVVVILYALLTTGAKVEAINAVGIAVALLGVTGYSVLAR
jgi:solute carrier family 35 protein E1